MPTGAKVISSHMVPGLIPGKFREIDVYIETKIGPYLVKIAVEAKDESRRFDVTSMEEIVGKYRGRNNISVNKVVVITHRGFTAEAIALAKTEDIEILTVEEASDHDWARAFPCRVHGDSCPRREPPKTFSIKMPPYLEMITFTPSTGSTEDDIAAVREGRIICKCHGTDQGNLIQIGHLYIAHQVLPNKELMAKMVEVAAQKSGKSALTVTLPISSHLLPNHVLRFRNKDIEIKSISLRVRYVDATAPFVVRQMVMKDAEGKESFVQYGEAEVAGKMVSMLMPFGNGFERGILKIDDPGPCEEIDFYLKPEYKGDYWQYRDGIWTGRESG